MTTSPFPTRVVPLPGVRGPAPGRGFTLIELMIAVAVLGIMAAIAYPVYAEYVARGRRSQVSAELLAAQQWMERFYSENLRYDQNAAGTATTQGSQFPARFATSPRAGEGAAAYRIELTSVARQSYTITASRAGAMANDRCGNFTIDHLGTRSLAAGSYSSSKFTDLAAAVRACWRQ
jgi:type IV pilus assembly protein PilE